jgi:hypothetical protein
MGILLLLLGVLAAGSGAVKLTARARRHHGALPLATVEVVVGAVVVLASGLGLGRVRPLAWAAVALTSVVVVASSLASVRLARDQRARQAASEGARLRRYLAGSGRPGDSGMP